MASGVFSNPSGTTTPYSGGNFRVLHSVLPIPIEVGLTTENILTATTKPTTVVATLFTSLTGGPLDGQGLNGAVYACKFTEPITFYGVTSEVLPLYFYVCGLDGQLYYRVRLDVTEGVLQVNNSLISLDLHQLTLYYNYYENSGHVSRVYDFLGNKYLLGETGLDQTWFVNNSIMVVPLNSPSHVHSSADSLANLLTFASHTAVALSNKSLFSTILYAGPVTFISGTFYATHFLLYDDTQSLPLVLYYVTTPPLEVSNSVLTIHEWSNSAQLNIYFWL